ncbi:MAG: polysaccharide biosynthesis protein [Phycisphaerae bacterium]|nr:polysaccharide biosynthesis protein [Phycisphaerae bacterium]
MPKIENNKSVRKRFKWLLWLDVRKRFEWLLWLESFVSAHKYPVVLTVHIVLFTVSLLLAFLIRYDTIPLDPEVKSVDWFTENFLRILPFFLIVKLIIFGMMKLLRGGWQYSGIRDVTRILLASWFFVVLAFVCLSLFYTVPEFLKIQTDSILEQYFSLFPRSVLVLDFLASVFMISTARLGFRIYREEFRPVAKEGARRVLVVGAGNAAEAIIREMQRMRVERYRVAGLVDDDPGKKGILIHGIPVLGTTEMIADICKENKIEEIIIAMPRATQKQLSRVVKLCTGTKLQFQSLPGVGDLIDGRVTVSQIRPVDINDLLGREVVQLDIEAVAKFAQNRVVLVTGAGGSIGSEMCRQICNYEPAGLVLVEQAETPMFDIMNELKRSFPEIKITPRICDIYDRQHVMTVWEDSRPDVVIHAAAHKHVPLMEWNPCEAIKNNVMGSKNVADASCRYEVSEFVTISTDKAVNPSSIMGCTKRVVEIYTQALNGRPGCKTQFKAVRFGNVLGSNGSVIPIFRKQIAAGGPITVTHPDMTRYFMTIPEAAQLVLQAAATGQGGQIFLLDMGDPVKIDDLARQMITLSGFRPDEDIDIVYSGIRPGEKLFEELRTEGEDIEPTVHPKVMVWAHQPVLWEKVEQGISELSRMVDCLDHEKVVAALKRIVPEFESLNPPTN